VSGGGEKADLLASVNGADALFFEKVQLAELFTEMPL
jgi:hypothetical protein